MNTWDETKRAKNLADHGIDLAELDGFFLGDLLTREDGDIAHLISARKAVSYEEKA